METCANQVKPLAYRIRQLADLVGVSVEFIRLQIESGDLPAYKVGKCVVIRPSDAEAWITRDRISPDTNGLHTDDPETVTQTTAEEAEESEAA